MKNLFLDKVVDVLILDEDGEEVSSKKYFVDEDEFGEFIEIYFDDIGKRKYYLKDNEKSFSLSNSNCS